jgi:hypothetical protein
MKNLSKTYKFIYMNNYGTHNQHKRSDFVFANREPKGYGNRWDVYNFFHHFDDRTMRDQFTDKKTRKTNCEDFLSGPATEAAITLAFVKKLTFELNQYRRRLTYLNKQFKIAETDTVKYPHGVNPMHYNVYNPNFYRMQIKHTKENLAIWKAKYESLKEQGVYTYLELMK